MFSSHRAGETRERGRFRRSVLPLISRLLAAAESPSDMLPLLADFAVEHAHADAVAIVRMGDDGRVAIAAMRNLPERCREWSADPDSIDAELAELLLRACDEGRFDRAITLPLRSGHDLFGALVLLCAQ